jgi:hypothetical protein
MDALSFAKILLDDGNAMSLDRDFYHRELKKRANATRRDGESEAQAYVRVLETPEGVTLHEAYKRAPVAPAPVPAPQGIKPQELGEASRAMNGKAKELAAAEKITFEQAFTRILLQPENKQLAAAVRAEERDLQTRYSAQMKPITESVRQ